MLTINLFKYSPTAFCQGRLIHHLASLSSCQFARYFSVASALYSDNDSIQLSNSFSVGISCYRKALQCLSSKSFFLAGPINNFSTKKEEACTERTVVSSCLIYDSRGL